MMSLKALFSCGLEVILFGCYLGLCGLGLRTRSFLQLDDTKGKSVCEMRKNSIVDGENHFGKDSYRWMI